MVSLISEESAEYERCAAGGLSGSRDRDTEINRHDGEDVGLFKRRLLTSPGHMAIRPPSDIQSVAIERSPHLAEPLCAQLAPVRELVVSIPAPRLDHRKH